MKKKLSLTEKISLAENNAVDFMHACVTIALHDEYEVGVQRLRKVNLRRDEINEEMLEVMAQPLEERPGTGRSRAGLAGEPFAGRGGNGVPGAVGTAAALAVALDGGVLVTADGVEVELYGSGGNA